MIKANELRIGNIVNVNDQFIKIENINEYGINYDRTREQNDYNIGNFRGVELTPEILDSLGFMEVGNTKQIIKCWGICWLRTDEGLSLIICDSNETVIKKATYLHDFQNIHYLLSGKEVKVKL